ncbi:hypothetical protein HD806DRAFT_491321 [Xylariaceae sp. AK1471]|nr:hypothetical protein HD806DRAFT_491321 [Xylariaceae sp. AK1471]
MRTRISKLSNESFRLSTDKFSRPSVRQPLSTAPASTNYTVAPPKYQEYNISQVVNPKAVSERPIREDGSRDFRTGLQAIINAPASAKHLVYFPGGICIVADTLLVPPGSQIHGTHIAALGEKF